MPMKWFKFLIWFSLFLTAFLNVSSAVQMFSQHRIVAQSIAHNTLLPEAQPFAGLITNLYLLLAALWLAMAVLAIVTRMQLAAYRKSGPVLLYITFALNAALEIIVMISMTWLLGKLGQPQPVPMSDFLATILSALVFIGCNYTYFRKRSYLFDK